MKPKAGWFRFWMIWLATFIVAEGIALFDRDRGDTLSESIWFLQGRFAGLTVALGVLLIWLFFHFIVDARSRKKGPSRVEDDRPASEG